MALRSGGCAHRRQRSHSLHPSSTSSSIADAWGAGQRRVGLHLVERATVAVGRRRGTASGATRRRRVARGGRRRRREGVATRGEEEAGESWRPGGDQEEEEAGERGYPPPRHHASSRRSIVATTTATVGPVSRHHHANDGELHFFLYVVPCLGSNANAARKSAVGFYELKNKKGDFSIKVTNWGAALVSAIVPDSKGNLADVVLGYDTAAEYMDKEGIVGAQGRRSQHL
ncbi:hypothetical protein ZWY2020_012672 [Hordeum vulgare]|nr:hypothetical protein ZWY2020_012672 [Hordeum vulgare]